MRVFFFSFIWLEKKKIGKKRKKKAPLPHTHIDNEGKRTENLKTHIYAENNNDDDDDDDDHLTIGWKTSNNCW